MTLAAGARLGPYEVLAKLGEGGMGEVYRVDVRVHEDRSAAQSLSHPVALKDPGGLFNSPVQ